MKTCFLALALVLICTCFVVATDSPFLVMPETWKPHVITDNHGCMNITGDFKLLGENAPESPNLFLERFPFSFDTMIGGDLPVAIRKQVTHVHIDQYDCSVLTFSYFINNHHIFTRILNNSDKNTLSCNKASLIIFEKPPESCSEGGCRMMTRVNNLYLSEDGSLILNSVYVGVDSFFYFVRKPFRKEYLVRFKRVKP